MISSALSWERWRKLNKLHWPKTVMWCFKGVMCGSNELSLSLIASFLTETLQHQRFFLGNWVGQSFLSTLWSFPEHWWFRCIRETHSSSHTFSLVWEGVLTSLLNSFICSSYSQWRWMWPQGRDRGSFTGWPEQDVKSYSDLWLCRDLLKTALIVCSGLVSPHAFQSNAVLQLVAISQ